MKLPPPPGRMIDIGGHRLHLHCQGRGPSVVLESALGGSSLSWSLVQPRLARFTRTCAVDRAGFGWSEAGPHPRTAGQIVEELRVLLERGGIAPPLIIVGHSFGALVGRLYQQRHPGDVAGLVLLDPPDPARWRQPSERDRALIARGTRLCAYGDRAARIRLADLAVRLVDVGAFGLARRVGRLASRRSLGPADEVVLAPAGKLPPAAREAAKRVWTQPRFYQALGSQIASISASTAEIDDDRHLGNLPLVVVSSEQSTAEERAAHAALAARSSRGRHLLAEGSGHWIPLDGPEVVVEAIRMCLENRGGN